jgi:hypothetical protein
VDGPAHQRDAGHSPAQDQLGQVIGAEPVQPRPKAVVGRERRLGLQPDQVLDRLDYPFGARGAVSLSGGQRHRAEQQLPVEQRAVQRLQAQHV